MTQTLLHYYNEELRKLRKLALQFADQHPHIASKLKIGPNSCQDPFIERLLESTAYLTAQLQQQLQQSDCLTSKTLLKQFHPLFLQTIPCLSILKITGKTDLVTVHTIARNTEIVAYNEQNCAIRFQTVYPTQLYPAEILAIRYQQCHDKSNAKSQLTLQIKLQNELGFSEANINSLRFYINLNRANASLLYYLLFQQCLTIKANDLNLSIIPVGFNKDQTLMPAHEKTQLSLQMLSDYFLLPEKFHFFDIDTQPLKCIDENRINLDIYFNQYEPSLLGSIDNNSLLLSCTPIINCFHAAGKPIRLKSLQKPYLLQADSGHETDQVEVIRIKQVRVSNSIKKYTTEPYFGGQYWHQSDNQFFWDEQQFDSSAVLEKPLPGKETFISLFHSNADTLSDDYSVHSQLICSNRDLPLTLPFSQNHPRFQLWDHADEHVESLQAIVPITDAQRHNNDSNLWQLIHKLTCNYQTLCQEKPLRSLLSVYNRNGNLFNQALIECINKVTCSPSIQRRHHHGQIGFIKGHEITIHINQQKMQQSTFYLLATLLKRLYTELTPINSFTCLLISNHKSDFNDK